MALTWIICVSTIFPNFLLIFVDKTDAPNYIGTPNFWKITLFDLVR